MRRWLLILLLLVYPFQVTLAMADQCCVTTAAGVTHHGTAGDNGSASAEPVLLADDAASALADPHCPACVFGHLSGVPAPVLAMPRAGAHASAIATPVPFFTSPPVARPERPTWSVAAE